MCVDRIEKAAALYCFKVTYDDGNIVYYVDADIGSAATSAEEIAAIKSIEYMGEGAIGS